MCCLFWVFFFFVLFPLYSSNWIIRTEPTCVTLNPWASVKNRQEKQSYLVHTELWLLASWNVQNTSKLRSFQLRGKHQWQKRWNCKCVLKAPTSFNRSLQENQYNVCTNQVRQCLWIDRVVHLKHPSKRWGPRRGLLCVVTALVLALLLTRR